jgi:hypothetical protein
VRPLVAALFVAVVAGSAACGGGDGSALAAYDVTITQTSRCTVTGAAARNCDDPAVLGQTTLRARWYQETADDGQSITITTHEGRTLTGLTFDNDGIVITAEGCAGEGGRCLFVRRRFQTIDANNNNCSTFGELIFVGHIPEDDADALVGRFSDVAGNTEECGTPTINEVAFSVVGQRAAQPVLALDEVDEVTP